MKCRQLLPILVIGLSLLVNHGCPAVLVGGAAGAGAVAYLAGELKSTERVSFNRAWKATQMAMDDLEFDITDKVKNASDAKLAAKRFDGKKANVELKRLSSSRTEIKIRVGAFGDESLSLEILQGIRKRY